MELFTHFNQHDLALFVSLFEKTILGTGTNQTDKKSTPSFQMCKGKS